MKGIILSGGEGTRLRPLTKVTSKQLLPIYNNPMVYYPLQTLLRAGVKDILFIISPNHAGDYLKYLGSGREFGAKFSFEIQDKPEGLAQAFIIGEKFIGNDNVCMILGDNIFEDDFSKEIQEFKDGAHVFLKEVADPERFGVAGFAKSGKINQIVEKPKEFVSNLAITGLYIYDNHVVQVAKELEPSSRGELEITDLHNWYFKRGKLNYSVVKGNWIDAGTFESLFKATEMIHEKNKLLNSGNN
ncbi:sugar phosphate nucleotidyltransferase [Candidatus Dojkabacteria bacterium]|jgi:glucose-1-phosphate thymidylyltransferase|nr:sugar phosphate nucleotidyltransferase [Candidatus Dojkabacteria bacterium]